VCCDFDTVTEIALPILMLHENVLDVDAAISIFSAVDAEIMETHYCVDYLVRVLRAPPEPFFVYATL
jgi:hypothetical protein